MVTAQRCSQQVTCPCRQLMSLSNPITCLTVGAVCAELARLYRGGNGSTGHNSRVCLLWHIMRGN